MNSAMPIWMIRRESNRSLSEPTHTEPSRYGTQCETTAKPPSACECSFSYATRYVMTCSMLSAIIASKYVAMNMRKPAFLSALCMSALREQRVDLAPRLGDDRLRARALLGGADGHDLANRFFE